MRTKVADGVTLCGNEELNKELIKKTATKNDNNMRKEVFQF